MKNKYMKEDVYMANKKKQFSKVKLFFGFIGSIASIFSIILTIYTIKSYNLNKKSEDKNDTRLLIKDINIYRDEKGKNKKYNYIRYFHEGENKHSGKKEILTQEKSGVTVKEKFNTDFIKELQEKKGSVYFTYLEYKPMLVLNLISDTELFILEHNNCIIKMELVGNSPVELSMIGIKIKDYQIDPKTGEEIISYRPFIEGDKNSTINIMDNLNNNELLLSFNEASTEYKNSICELSNDLLLYMPNGYSILKQRFEQYFLKYSQLQFIIKIKDTYGNTFYNNIIVEKEGNKMRTDTKNLSKSDIKKIRNDEKKYFEE